MRKLIFAAALLMTSAGAFAQSSDSTGAQDTMKALADPAMMSRFYTDSAMTTMKDRDGFMAAYNEMSEADRNTVLSACKDVQTQRDTFCDMFNSAHMGKM